MTRYSQFILALLHVFLCWHLTVWILQLSVPAHWFGYWLLFCTTSVWWHAPFVRLFMNIRKPFSEEKAVLMPLFNELCLRSGDTRKYRILIAEKPGIGAFAFGTNIIAINKPCLKELRPDQLAAILAHEIGHHQTWDPAAGFCISTCSKLPFIIMRVFHRNKVRVMLTGLMTLLTGMLVYYVPATSENAAPLLLACRLWLSLVSIVYWNLLFLFLYRIDGRYTEYRQDACAQRLGYGAALVTVLKGFITKEFSDVRPWSVIYFGTHPITHSRIARLEELEESSGAGSSLYAHSASKGTQVSFVDTEITGKVF
ncbi:MAG: M48 family metalloprotease [Chitinophagaceae bacterium]|nr:M48 family metalloprotease [Chitinophagaceae bacterium]